MKTNLIAGESKIFSQQGGRFYFIGGEDEIHVKLNSGGDTRVYKLLTGQGVHFESGRFNSVEIRNGATDQQIEFEVYDREVFDNRVPGLLDVDLVVAPVCRDIVDQPIASGETDVIAQDLGRKRIVIYADPDNDNYLRVGPNAGASRGVPVPPGGSIAYDGSFELRVHNIHGDSQKYGWYSEGS